jgi:DNA-binding NarL/FixJ family response regulator
MKEIKIMVPNNHVEVLTLLSQGMTKKEIADKMNSSEATIKKIVGVLLQNFNCRNCPQLVNKAIRCGII